MQCTYNIKKMKDKYCQVLLGLLSFITSNINCITIINIIMYLVVKI